jgi:hypothetical protein
MINPHPNLKPPRINMQTARFLFTIVGLGAFTLGRCLAAEPFTPPSERAPRENHPTGVRPADPVHGSRERREPNFASSSQTGPVKPQSKRTPPHELPQPMLKKAATAAHGAWMMNKIQNHHEPAAKLPGNAGATAPGPGISRNRNATPAVLGGLTTASAKHSTAALDGAAVKRKP